jgi:hypothetical protein
MKTWLRVLMIVAGIMIAVALVVYTDPSSLREFIRDKYTPARIAL